MLTKHQNSRPAPGRTLSGPWDLSQTDQGTVHGSQCGPGAFRLAGRGASFVSPGPRMIRIPVRAPAALFVLHERPGDHFVVHLSQSGLPQGLQHPLRVSITAHEYVQCHVPQLGPGVHRNVGFSQGNDPGDPRDPQPVLGFKIVEKAVEHRGPCPPGSLTQ